MPTRALWTRLLVVLVFTGAAVLVLVGVASPVVAVMICTAVRNVKSAKNVTVSRMACITVYDEPASLAANHDPERRDHQGAAGFEAEDDVGGELDVRLHDLMGFHRRVAQTNAREMGRDVYVAGVEKMSPAEQHLAAN